MAHKTAPTVRIAGFVQWKYSQILLVSKKLNVYKVKIYE